jgi:hypothetical protein
MNNATLYRNRKSGDRLVQRYSGIYAAGRFVKVSAAEMKAHGLEIILNHLNDEPSDEPELNTFSKEEDKTFRRDHRGVSVDFSGQDIITAGPLRRKGSGYVVRKEDVIQLARPCTDEEFIAALDQALA